MNWGKGIIISFIIFAGILTVMVVISMKEEVGLVAPDYYKQEITYQDQIDRMNNYNQLVEKPRVRIDRVSNEIVLNFPMSMTSSIENGEVHLFRPSTAKLDQKYTIKLGEAGEQRINISQLIKGRWKVKLYWESSSNSLQYYNEVAINL